MNVDLIDDFERAVDANGYRSRDAYTEAEYERTKKALQCRLSAADDLLKMLKVAQLWLDIDGRFDMQGINSAISKYESSHPLNT